MRLNAWLARAGVASRRESDELIKAGRITVNGEPGQLNTFVTADDDVRLDGRPLRSRASPTCCCTSRPVSSRRRATRRVGRRSSASSTTRRASSRSGGSTASTTGVLLLTNDGELAHRLAHPKYEVEKVYVAELDSRASDATIAKLARGSGRSTTGRPRRRRCADSGARSSSLTIHEGRNRQVRRMFEAVGHRVRHLHRSRYGPLTLEGLEPGAWRELEPSEVERLRSPTTRPRGQRPRRAGSAPGLIQFFALLSSMLPDPLAALFNACADRTREHVALRVRLAI